MLATNKSSKITVTIMTTSEIKNYHNLFNDSNNNDNNNNDNYDNNNDDNNKNTNNNSDNDKNNNNNTKRIKNAIVVVTRIGECTIK